MLSPRADRAVLPALACGAHIVGGFDRPMTQAPDFLLEMPKVRPFADEEAR